MFYANVRLVNRPTSVKEQLAVSPVKLLASYMANITLHTLAWLDLPYLSYPRAHLASSDDRYMLDNNVSDRRGRQTSADVVSEEGHVVAADFRSD